MTDPTDHDELRTLADKLDDIAQRAEEEHISGVRPALRKWDTDRLHAAADMLRDDLQRRQRAYLATKRLTAERDAERAARERAETEARQLREAIEDRLRQVLAVHGQFLGDWDEWTSLGALEGYNGLTVTARTALAHLHGRHDDSPLPTMHCVLCETFRVPAVAEGAEDRGQTDG